MSGRALRDDLRCRCVVIGRSNTSLRHRIIHMKSFFFAAALAFAAAMPCRAAETITLAENGKTDYTIVYDLDAHDPLLDPVVRDLADTLKEITGAEFPIRPQADGPAIRIGKVPPGDKADFAARERRIKSVGRDLYIYGDHRHGTSGAVYNFLAKFCGCRWFTATGDKLIPKQPTLKFAAIDYRNVPSFKSIEHGSRYTEVQKMPGIRNWVRRNNAFLMPDYAFGEPDDAWFYIGPVTHTLAAYMPPLPRKPRSFNADGRFFAGPHPALADKAYFEEHPEYFSLDRSGTRSAYMQVCFSNPEVRRILLENIEKVIRAEKYDPGQYAVLDFSQNDEQGGFCFCENCKKLADKYQSPGGPYFDFLVEMSRHFEKKYPKLSFRFFAYQEDMTGIPPIGIKFPDNLAVILAPLDQDFSKPFSDRYNVHFLRQIRRWGKLCREIWIWNYPTLYPHGMHIYSLFPGVYRNARNLKLAHAAGTRYIIAEQGGSLLHGCAFKELNTYLQNAMAENVGIDVDATVKEFCDAVYGKAADDVIAYLKDTDEQARKDPGFFRYYYDPRVMRRVLHSPRNLVRWQRDFDRMEEKVRDDPQALFNIRRARINLDAVTVLCYPECAKFDPGFARTLSLDALYDRYCRYVKDDLDRLYRGYPERDGYQWNMDAFINSVRMAYEFNRRKQSFPAELIERCGEKNLFAVMPCQSRRAPAVWDDATASGYAVRVAVPGQWNGVKLWTVRVGEKDGLPWNDVTVTDLRQPMLRPMEIKKIRREGGWHLCRVGRAKLSESGMAVLRTLPNRDVRFFLGAFYDPEDPDRKFDIYLSFKDGGDGKSLLIDRMVLAKCPDENQ